MHTHLLEKRKLSRAIPRTGHISLKCVECSRASWRPSCSTVSKVVMTSFHVVWAGHWYLSRRGVMVACVTGEGSNKNNKLILNKEVMKNIKQNCYHVYNFNLKIYIKDISINLNVVQQVTKVIATQLVIMVIT